MQSDLEVYDKAELVEVLVHTNDDKELESLANLFEESPESIKKISANYKAKRAAFATKEPDVWNKILKKEETELEKLEE